MSKNHVSHFVLVCGTGKDEHISQKLRDACTILGEQLANMGLGLVTGRWPGVDKIVTESYARTIQEKTDKKLSDCLIQVVTNGNNRFADNEIYKGGTTVDVNEGSVDEWVKGLQHSDAVILLGGEGGTYEMYNYALQEQVPVFPFVFAENNGTSDTARAFLDFTTHNRRAFERLFPRITLSEFTETLTSRTEKETIADRISRAMKLVKHRLETEHRNIVFVSYSRKDKEWLDKLLDTTRSLSRFNIHLWHDTTIEAGDIWHDEIQSKIESAVGALFILSDDFFTSEYIQKDELPKLLKKAEDANTRIFWVYARKCSEENMEHMKKLSGTYQAAHEVAEPLEALPPPKQKIQLRKVCESIIETLKL